MSMGTATAVNGITGSTGPIGWAVAAIIYQQVGRECFAEPPGTRIMR